MTTKYMDCKESMTTEVTNLIKSHARALSLANVSELTMEMPALRERLAEIQLDTYLYLSDQLEFLCRFVEEQVVGRKRDLVEEALAEATFALLYFRCATDMIPDAIPHMGLLDDAMTVGMVLRRQEQVFKRSSHAQLLRWPEPKFDIDQLLSVISPFRVTSFCSSWAIRT